MYTDFARVYDRFMADTPYDRWLALIEGLWRDRGFDPHGRLVLDLGCGTGCMTLRLHGRGCDMIGIDSSRDMLAIAAAKAPEAGILYLCQDMRRLELYGTVDSVVCVCDGINYLTKPRDVLKVFKLVYNYLNPGGIFIFDINTRFKYQSVLAGNSFSEVKDDCAYIWDNFYNESNGINEYSLSFFIENESGLYARYDELHYQRAYGVKTITGMLAGAGLTLDHVCDEHGGSRNRRSERLFFTAVRQ